MGLSDSFSDLFSAVRSGAESWKAISGSKKAKKLTDSLDKAASIIYGSPGASPPENPVSIPAAPAAIQERQTFGIPTWGLLAIGAGVVYLAVRR